MPAGVQEGTKAPRVVPGGGTDAVVDAGSEGNVCTLPGPDEIEGFHLAEFHPVAICTSTMYQLMLNI